MNFKTFLWYYNISIQLFLGAITQLFCVPLQSVRLLVLKIDPVTSTQTPYDLNTRKSNKNVKFQTFLHLGYLLTSKSHKISSAMLLSLLQITPVKV